MSKRNIRLNQGEEYVFGRNVVHESLKAGRKGIRLFLENSLKAGNDARISDIISIAQKMHVPIDYLSKEEMREIEDAGGIKSEGIALLVESREILSVHDLLARCKTKNKEPFFIILNNILYEENLGAILRTAAAGGVDGIIIPKREKRGLSATVVRISMGGSEYVPLVKDNLFEALDILHNEGIKIIGVELSGDHYYFDEDLTGPIALVLGGEDAGVSGPLLKRCDSIVRLPMIGQIQSLNVSVSTGIMIYEKIRQECQN